MQSESKHDESGQQRTYGTDPTATVMPPVHSGAAFPFFKNLTLMQAAIDAYFEVRAADSLITGVNEAYCEIIGYSQSELLAMRLAELEEPKPPSEVKAHTATTAVGFDRYETRHRHRDGHLVDLEVSSVYVHAEGLFCNFARDITEQKQSDALKKSILDAIISEIVVLDHRGIVITVNENWRQYTRENLDLPAHACRAGVGDNYLDTLRESAATGDADAEPARDGILAVLDGRLAKFSTEYAHHSAQRHRWLNMTVTPLPGPGMRGAVVAHTDITEQTRIEEMLRKKTIAVEQSPAAVVIVDIHALIQYVNPRFTEVTGYSAAEVIGQNPRILQSGQTPMAVHQALWDKLNKGETWHGQLINKRKNGEVFWDEVDISPLKNAQGLVTHYVAVHTDITERKLAEEALRLSRAQLNAFVRHAPMSIAMVDRRMCYIAHSDRWQRDYGRGYAQLIGISHYDVYPDLPDNWMAQHNAAMEGATFHGGEEMRRRDDGGISWVSRVVAPWRDDKGAIGGIIIAVEDVTERKLAESDLHKVLEESGDAIWITDPAGGFIFANPAALKLTGHSIDEICRLSIPDTVLEDHPGELADHLARLDNQKFIRREWKMAHRNGVSIPVELTTGHLTDGRYMAFGRDLTEKRRADAELRKLFQAVEQNPESILITNIAAEIEYVNQAFLSKTGYSRAEIIGQNPRILHSGKTPPEQYVALWAALKKGETWQGELHNRSKHACDYTDFATISPIRQADGSVSHYVAIQEDVTARKISEVRIHELAYFDQLTGLPNRILLQDRLNQLLTASARSGEHGALLFIDLDNFKTVNDTLGHHVGDELLTQVGKYLSRCARESDTVARFGGDEFVVLLGGLGLDESNAAIGAKTAAQKMLAALDCTYQLGDVAQHATASIGVTLFQGDRVPPGDLLKQADLAMYQSKIRGRNLVRFFDPSLESEMMERSVMEEELRHAIDENQFQLHYQAQCNEKGELTGAEVLVRWQHPRRGLVSPAVFIPFAEETGLILPIGEWVLDTACRQLATWSANPTMANLTLAVNVSAVQFRQSNFVENVLRVVRDTGAPPTLLKLELTESMLVANVDEIIEKMLTLKKLGIRFSLDDFGTGYSSLSYLKRLPLDQLKIDQSFVKHVLSDSNDAAIASTIVTLAKSLGLGVIAEGVETENQRQFLADAGCNAYQGYLFSKPIPVAQFEELARR